MMLCPASSFPSLRCCLRLLLISCLGLLPSPALAQQASGNTPSLAELVPYEFSHLIAEVDFRLWHELNEMEKEEGPQGPHVKPLEFSFDTNDRSIGGLMNIPQESLEKALWGTRPGIGPFKPGLCVIQTRDPIDVEKLKQDGIIDSEPDTNGIFEVTNGLDTYLLKLISPNLAVQAKDQENLDAFLDFQNEPVATRKSAAAIFSDPNFVFRMALRDPPARDEAIPLPPLVKQLAPDLNTVAQVVLNIDLTDNHKFTAQIRGTFTTEDAAKDASLKFKMAKSMLEQVFELYLADTELPKTYDPAIVENWPHCLSVLSKLLNNIQTEVNGKQCVIQTECDQEFYDTAVAIAKKFPVQKARQNDLSRMQKILSALQYYHFRHGQYPTPTIIDEKSGHARSWRVELLNYMRDDDLYDIYKQYRKDEPWNSEANLKLLDASVSVFSSSWETDPHAASFFFVLGKGTAMEDEKPKVTQIKDPLPATVLIVSADRDIPWTMPADLNFEDALDLKKLGVWDNDQVLVGTAQLVPMVILSDFSPESWRNMLLKADGNPVKIPEQFRPIKRANR